MTTTKDQFLTRWASNEILPDDAFFSGMANFGNHFRVLPSHDRHYFVLLRANLLVLKDSLDRPACTEEIRLFTWTILPGPVKSGLTSTKGEIVSMPPSAVLVGSHPGCRGLFCPQSKALATGGDSPPYRRYLFSLNGNFRAGRERLAKDRRGDGPARVNKNEKYRCQVAWPVPAGRHHGNVDYPFAELALKAHRRVMSSGALPQPSALWLAGCRRRRPQTPDAA